MTTDWKRLADFAAARPAEAFALATLLAREGSSYRQPGARLLISADGDYIGCLSGGCLEEGIAAVGTRVLSRNLGERLRIDTRPHFGCPGILDVWVEPAAQSLLTDIAATLDARRPAWLETRADAHGTRLYFNPPTATPPDGGLRCALGLLPRLVVVGAASDTEPLLELARWMGWDVQRVLPPTESPRLTSGPAGEVLAADALLARYPADERTACVVMTHHLGRDFSYLRQALAGGYPYVGLLGSRRRRESLLSELGDAGELQDETVTSRLHAPVGLDLGADDPRGVALAIVAEIQAAWANASAQPLRSRVGPLHRRTES